MCAESDPLIRILEINTGLICSCTPALKPFVNHFAPLLKSNSSDMRQAGHMSRRVGFVVKEDIVKVIEMAHMKTEMV